jgi:hypothetical protein
VIPAPPYRRLVDGDAVNTEVAIDTPEMDLPQGDRREASAPLAQCVLRRCRLPSGHARVALRAPRTRSPGAHGQDWVMEKSGVHRPLRGGTRRCSAADALGGQADIHWRTFHIVAVFERDAVGIVDQWVKVTRQQ